jgi:hypothetical protein
MDEPSTVVAEGSPSRTSQFTLGQNYPNPFALETVIPFQLERTGNAKFEVFDLAGRRIKSDGSENRAAGAHKVTLETSGLVSGVYYYRLTVDGESQVRKLTVTK